MPIDRSAERTAAGAATPPRLTWAAVRPLLRLHFCAGVFIGPFLLVAAVTGPACVWTPQVERAVCDHELRVPAAGGADRGGAVPDGTVTGVRPGPTPADSTQVVFDRPGLAPGYHHTVFVDPHTGAVRGQLETYGSGQAMPLRGMGLLFGVGTGSC